MIVAIDCRLLDKKKNTGISRFTEFIINFYIQFIGENNIILITNDFSFFYGNCQIAKTNFKPYRVFDFIRFPFFLKSLNIDILHSPFYSGLFFKSFKFKNIITVHDLMYRKVSGFFGSTKLFSSLKRIYFDFIIFYSLRNSDAIVTVSETTKEDLFSIFKFNSYCIPEESIISDNDNISFLQRHNLKHKNYFFYCGNNRPHKNLKFILDIFSNDHSLPILVLAGSEHSSIENVIAVGQVSEDELKVLYKSCIAFIFPSLYEGFGLPILECLQSRSLVIASDIKAFREFNSKNILFFELGSTSAFLNCLVKSQNQDFIEEFNFWDKYSKSNIHEKYSILLNIVLNVE